MLKSSLSRWQYTLRALVYWRGLTADAADLRDVNPTIAFEVGWMDGWVDRWRDGGMNGSMDRWIDREVNLFLSFSQHNQSTHDLFAPESST